MVGIVSLKIITLELIALDNDNSQLTLLNQIKKDFKSFGIATLILTIVFMIIFYKTNIFITIWAVLSFLLTFVLPGFILCYLWYNKLDFIERFIIGTILGLISVGILSYNISMYLGMNIKTISVITPIIVILIYGYIVYFVEKNQHQKHHKRKIKTEKESKQESKQEAEAKTEAN